MCILQNWVFACKAVVLFHVFFLSSAGYCSPATELEFALAESATTHSPQRTVADRNHPYGSLLLGGAISHSRLRTSKRQWGLRRLSRQTVSVFLMAAVLFLVLRCSLFSRVGRQSHGSQRSLAAGGSHGPGESKAPTQDKSLSDVCQGASGPDEAEGPFGGEGSGGGGSTRQRVEEMMRDFMAMATRWLEAAKRLPDLDKMRCLLGIQVLCAVEHGVLAVLVDEDRLEQQRKANVENVKLRVGQLVRETKKQQPTETRRREARRLTAVLEHVMASSASPSIPLSAEERRLRLEDVLKIQETIRDLVIEVLEELELHPLTPAAANRISEKLWKLARQRKDHIVKDVTYRKYFEGLQAQAPGSLFHSPAYHKRLMQSGPLPADRKSVV